MSKVIERASKEEIEAIIDEVKILIDDVDIEVAQRMKEREEEAKRYAREQTLKNHPFLQRFLSING